MPLGTANALYMAINGEHSALLPIDIACQVICRGHHSLIDTIRCNEQLSLLMIGLGFESDMIHNADRDAKNDSGQWAYLKSFWQALNDNSSLLLRYRLDNDTEFEQKTASLVVANAAPLSSLLARGDGRPSFNDGKLAITLIPEQENLTGNIASMLEILLQNSKPDIFKGTQDNKQDDSNQNVITWNPERIHISGNNTLRYIIDGETFSADSLDIEINHQSLSVFTP